MRRRRSLIALFVVAIAVVAIRPALADAGSEARLAQLLNDSRASAGLGPLSVSAELSGLAQQRAANMAAQGRIFHSSLDGIDGKRVGENVGVASTVDTVHQLFLQSSTHYANIVGDYAEVGIGVVWADGQAYVDELFRLPWDSAPAAAPAPEPVVVEPAPEPAPQPAPVAATEPVPAPIVTEPAPAPEPTTTTVVERTSPLTFGSRVLPIAHTSAIAAGLPAQPTPDSAGVALIPALAAIVLVVGLLFAHGRVLVSARARH